MNGPEHIGKILDMVIRKILERGIFVGGGFIDGDRLVDVYLNCGEKGRDIILKYRREGKIEIDFLDNDKGDYKLN